MWTFLIGFHSGQCLFLCGRFVRIINGRHSGTIWAICLSPADSKLWKQEKTRKAGFKWLVLQQCDIGNSFIFCHSSLLVCFLSEVRFAKTFFCLCYINHLNCLVFGQVPWMRDLIALLPQPGPIVTFQQVSDLFFHL